MHPDSGRVWRLDQDLAQDVPLGSEAFANRWVLPEDEPESSGDESDSFEDVDSAADDVE